MKTKKIYTAVVFLFVIFILVACTKGGKSALIGEWVDGWDEIAFFKDGTGIVNVDSCSWKVENNRLIISGYGKAFILNYEISGKKLILTGSRTFDGTYVKKTNTMKDTSNPNLGELF